MVERVSRTEKSGGVAQGNDKPSAGAHTALRSDNLVGKELPPVDFVGVDELLTNEERAIRDRTRAFVDAEILPIIADYWERGEFPTQVIPSVARLGVMGGNIEGYGCPGMSPLAEGLAYAELARGDVGMFALFGVSSLAMHVIDGCGSEEQKQRWLPEMARMEKLGAFALTEPHTGSNASGMETRARRDGDHYVIDGAKRWIGNARDADLIAVWARDDEGKVGAFVVEQGTPGVSTTFMAGKGSARVVPNYDLTFEGTRIPLENRLARCQGFGDVGSILTNARFNVACVALGQAMACYEAALAYATERGQFGKPIGSFQLVQQKLVWMLDEISLMQLLILRLGRLLESGKMSAEQASMAKMNNASKARQIAAQARDILGGNGILLENRVARQQADAEATYSYEGTDHVQTLIVGRKITGLNAFA